MDWSELGFAFLKARKSKRLTQDQLSSLANISRTYLSLIERGKANNMSLSIFLSLSNVLELNTCKLLEVLCGGPPIRN
jgi:transcriptional regulator with XRE-family HTH domain